MTLTAKTVSSKRRPYVPAAGTDGDGTIGSGIPKALMDRGDGFEGGNVTPGNGKAVCYAVAEYDFSEDGAVGAAAFFGTGVLVPANAVVTRAGMYTDVLVAGPAQNGATLYGAGVGATASADNNLVASAAVETVIGTSTIGVPVPATAATWLHTGPLPREIVIDFAGGTTAATTAGRILVWVEYFMVSNVTPTT